MKLQLCLFSNIIHIWNRNVLKPFNIYNYYNKNYIDEQFCIRSQPYGYATLYCRDGDSIQVFVRVRPPGRQEGDLDLGACVSVDAANNALILKAKPDPKVFTFDQVADVKTTQVREAVP